MSHANPALFARLDAFEIGPGGATLSFRDRLARENGWTTDFADRVVAEYKRFVYLACVAGHPVTPSDQIDQAWHLHLTYTRSYWTEMCGEILERPLHHGPTRGGQAEGRKFRDWYGRTRESYASHFESPPPRDIWPESKKRFADADRFRRVNTAQTWLLDRPEIFRRSLPGRVGVLTGALVALASFGCASLFSGDSEALASEVGVFALIVVIGLAVVNGLRSLFKKQSGRDPVAGDGDTGAPFVDPVTGERRHRDEPPEHDDASGGDAGGDSGCGAAGCGGCGGGGD